MNLTNFVDLRYYSKVYTCTVTDINYVTRTAIMKISELADKTGISVHTLRYYEKTGLLKASARSASNYRIYTKDDFVSAKFIQRCKNTGFSLAETASLLAIKDDKSHHVCAEAKAITQNKLSEIVTQIEQLQHMHTTLTELKKYCCGGQESAEFCSIIAVLEEGELNAAN